MHTTSDYCNVLERIMRQAELMVECISSPHDRGGREVINFLHTYGCIGWPSETPEEFQIGPWLRRKGRPARQQDGVTVIPCFHDDMLPLPMPSGTFVQGCCFRTDQVIVLYNTDDWSYPELALTLLHEGYHARHRIGPALAGLPQLDVSEEAHETNAWMLMLNTLVAWGADAWNTVVRKEIAWLRQQQLKPRSPRHIVFAESTAYAAEMDVIFLPTQQPQVLHVRKKLVAIHANMEYWSERNPALRPEDILHQLVRVLGHSP